MYGPKPLPSLKLNPRHMTTAVDHGKMAAAAGSAGSSSTSSRFTDFRLSEFRLSHICRPPLAHQTFAYQRSTLAYQNFAYRHSPDICLSRLCLFVRDLIHLDNCLSVNKLQMTFAYRTFANQNRPHINDIGILDICLSIVIKSQ